jgi:hypothetical protein
MECPSTHGLAVLSGLVYSNIFSKHLATSAYIFLDNPLPKLCGKIVGAFSSQPTAYSLVAVLIVWLQWINPQEIGNS